MHMPSDFTENAKHLNEQGFLLIPGALSADTIAQWKEVLYGLYERKEYEIDNSVGNVAFEKLLALQPNLSKELIGHSSAEPIARNGIWIFTTTTTSAKRPKARSR
jgi:hypothetical protein